jgi:hypothetical protein
MNHVRDFAAGSIGISDPKCGCWLEMDKARNVTKPRGRG